MSLIGDISAVFSKFTKFPVAIVGRGGDKRFLHGQWVTGLGRWDTLILNHKGYSKSNRTQSKKYVCITNWGSFVLLQIRVNVFTNWGSFIITNWDKCCYKLGSYYKLRQPLLQNRAAITNWGRYYKLGQLLQIWAKQHLSRPIRSQIFLHASDKFKCANAWCKKSEDLVFSVS